MKRFVFLPLLLLGLAACDEIPRDEYVKELDFNVSPNDSSVQRVILEEFTGVKCNNCPEANRQAKNLQTLYGDRLILLAIHAGNLATTGPDHPRAFNTPEGTELFNFFSLFGVPAGFVNRKDYSSASPFDIIKLQDDWGSEVESLLNDAPLLKLELSEDNYNPGNRELNVSGNLTVLDMLPSADIHYCVYLAENRIISPQTLGDKTVNPNYEHNHVFRGSFNGTYGEPIDLSSGNADFSEQITLDSEIVKENCEVIAFAYDRSNYRILQVSRIEI